MRWSAAGLKGTLGAGCLCVAAVYWDWSDPQVGSPLDLEFLVPFFVAMGPFLILFFLRPDEVSERIHWYVRLTAVAWYLLLIIAAGGLMSWRGLRPSDLALGFFMALGFWPWVSLVRSLAPARHR
ncbi:MAG: hypothetical protein MRY74_01505 [Neomegalonema sp.]|nr:hypothetical protein [Neomegalonema sp.]